ncbi:MAG: 3-dehydroquinate synthase [Verrucomicrobiota bacterium]|nr:3-dehydroquinate synthase [Verrucomicrobiota bacterium]
MHTLEVGLGARSYSIRIGTPLTAEIRAVVDALRAAGKPVALVTDQAVARKQAKFLAAIAGDIPTITIPKGETSKSFRQLERICEFLAAERVDRSGALIAVGGGVVGDLAGFAAAAYLRGIAFYQVPTTLLAMVDSSVGGKTGINLKAGKNLTGAFWQPNAVYADTGVLATLPKREFSAGMAEVIKYGLLADASLFNQLASLNEPLHAEHPALAGVILRCCELKAQIVGDDERELKPSGGRALLNLGHTFGHAIEAVAGYGAYLHGEAVGLGLVLAARLSQELGYISGEDVAKTTELIAHYNLPTRLREPLPVEQLLAAMKRDKKVRAGKLRFVVMRSLGTAETCDCVDEAVVDRLWRQVGAV